MLTLSRKPGGWIRIGDDIRICLVRVGLNTARLGIEAPQHMNIVREELLALDAAVTEPQPQEQGKVQ